jgi:hypothetical protein
MWMFVPRLPTKAAYDVMQFSKYQSIDDIVLEMEKKSYYYRGLIIFHSPLKKDIEFNSTKMLSYLLKDIKDKTSIRKLYVYDTGYFCRYEDLCY